MRDISHKITTLRTAHAEATLRMAPESIKVVTENTGPKQDIPATARAAGYLAVKNTSNVLPHCHPTPVENVTIDFEYGEDSIRILIEVQAIYRTGCEMEALHGASIAALTMYDMLKPVDQHVEIENIRLVKKTGGKNDFKDNFSRPRRASIVSCSDLVIEGKKDNKAGEIVREKLSALDVEILHEMIIPETQTAIEEAVTTQLELEIDVLVIAGGTGVGPRDIVPEVVSPMLDKGVPGVMQLARQYGFERTPYAMMSRGVAGVIGTTLILCIPGSSRGAKETLEGLLPHVLHISKVLEKHAELG